MPIKAKKKEVQDLGKMIHLIWGVPGSGKSTLASQFPGATFICSEKGLDHVSCSRWEREDSSYVIKSWEELLTATAEVMASKPTTIVLDTLGNLCLLADDYVCRKAGVEYKTEGTLGYGRGAAMIGNELRRYLNKLSASGIGVIMIAHAMNKTVTTRTGEIQRTIPFVPTDSKSGELYNLILGMADTVLYLDTERDGTRVIRTKPEQTFDAKDRTGLLPPVIKLPKESEKAFATLYEAYHGKPLGK